MTTPTESSSLAHRELETLQTGAMLTAMLDGQGAALAAVQAALPALDRAVEEAAARLADRQGRLVYVGAGTSGRIAMLDGIELYPTFGWPEGRAAFLLAGGEASVAEARESAEDDADAGRAAIAGIDCRAGDVAVGLAASGSTPYTLAAIDEARGRGALTIGLANNPGSTLLSRAEIGVLLDTGPEVLAGSTRMAAGTSQKIAMNLFSTAVMMRLGRVYRGLMVDMKATNQKLRRRAVAMLMQLTGCDEPAALDALGKTGFHVKPAVLVVRGLSPDEAGAALERNGSDLHKVFAELNTDG
ncbi:N-acetylmuramic acid 6-phosphate etherase [Nitratireductor soli]|uniref:N-acetylmuramic acid 6-phosphate etherase n=1 Tax=Nitratireductor soli TaxID=1670619 RepID=UPI00065E031F|nr:N-acetylmuramic acid 6-phosphate etherase [Nitratireductor soli]